MPLHELCRLGSRELERGALVVFVVVLEWEYEVKMERRPKLASVNHFVTFVLGRTTTLLSIHFAACPSKHGP